ncbi:MAG: DUF3526 domain-containing protein [Steroidobacteraceae bacterium]
MTSKLTKIGQELQLLRRERLAPWSFVLLVLLLVAAAANGRALLAKQNAMAAALRADYATLVAALREQAGRGVETATAPGALGFSVLANPAVLPPASLGPLAVGQSDLLPAHYPITARGAHTFLTQQELDNPLRLALGNFDVAFVIVWLLPLVIIALSFNLVSGERERGVLAMSVAAGASITDLIAAKFAARVLSVLAALTIGILGAALVTRVPIASATDALALAGVWLGAALYALIWFALALWVNSKLRNSDQNATILAGAWLAFVIIAPALTNLAAVTAFAPPSRVTLTTELREASEAADRAAAADRDQYFFDHPDMQGGEMDTSAYYQSVARSEASIEQAIMPLLAQFDTQAERQQRVVSGLQYLSPSTLTYQMLTALAGGDGVRHREFRRQALLFHRDWREFFVRPMERGARLSAADYANLPEFAFRDSPIGHTLLRVAPSAGALLLVTLLLLVSASRRLRRLPLV